MKKYRIAINSAALDAKIPIGDKRWGTFNDEFRNLTLPILDIANYIYLGHAYTTWHEGRRSIENFELGQHIAIDMDSADERSSFDTLLQHDLIRMYGGLLHTTPSHASSAPRARVIFFLDEPLMDANGYQAAATFLVNQFDGCDTACTDAARFFYGSKSCEIHLCNNVLPVAHLRWYYKRWRQTQPRYMVQPQPQVQPRQDYATANIAGPDAIDVVVTPVESSHEGERNITLNRQAFLAGKDVSKGLFSETEIVPQLLRAAQQVGLSEQEAMRTINSGIRAGKRAGM